MPDPSWARIGAWGARMASGFGPGGGRAGGRKRSPVQVQPGSGTRSRTAGSKWGAPDGPTWTCSQCGLGEQFGFRTFCRKPTCRAPRAGGAWAGGQQQVVSLAAKLKAAEEREKALKSKVRTLESGTVGDAAAAGAGAGQEPTAPWAKGKELKEPTEVEKLLGQKKSLETHYDCSSGAAAELLAEVEAKLQAARESRDRAKPTSAQLREANLRAEKAAAVLEAAEAEQQRCQSALQAAKAKVLEAKMADEAARAQQVEVQARVATEGPSRGVANDVDVLRVQCKHLASRIGVSLEELGLAAGLTKLATDLERKAAEDVADAAAGEPPAAGGGGSAAPGAGQAAPAPSAEPRGAGEPGEPAMAVDEEAPRLTEEEEAWLNGGTAPPDGTAEPEKHKRYVEVLEQGYARLAKRQRQG